MKNGKRAAGPMGILRMFVLMTVWLGAGTAWADEVPVTKSAAAACLRKPSEPLKYPERAKELRTSGSLKARLTFTRPDRAPSIEILAWGGSPELADAAEIYLRGYRVPCLGDGQSVALDQEVVFTALADEDTQAAGRTESVWGCLRTPGPFTYMEDMQTGRLIKQKANGTVLLELTFDAPDAPPKLRQLYNSTPNAFATAVEHHASEYRLPCLKSGSGPARMRQAFRFRASTVDRDLVLNDMSLVPFLRAVKDVDKVHVKFDLGTMGCPFKLKWRMYEPADSNDVIEVGPRVAQRQPFMDWLSTLSLDLGKDQMEALLGAQMVLTVPCGTVDL